MVNVKEWTKMTRVQSEAGGVHCFIKGESVARALIAARIKSDHTDLECRVDEILTWHDKVYIMLEIRKRLE